MGRWYVFVGVAEVEWEMTGLNGSDQQSRHVDVVDPEER